MSDIVDALAFKLQSKICYHRDANLDYLEIKAMVDKLIEENKKFRDEKMEYLDMINTVIEEKENLQHDYQVIKEQVEPMEEQLEAVKKELAAAKEQLVAAKHENDAAKHEHVVANEELMAAKEQLLAAKHENAAAKNEHAVAKEKLAVVKAKLAQKNEELELLRKGIQESEAMHTQLQQQKRSAPCPEPVHSRWVTRSSHEHVVEKEEVVVAKEKLARKNEELEVLRKKLQESEAMHTQLQQQKRSAPGPEPVHSRRVTRSSHEHVVEKEELVVAKEKLARKNEELEVLRKKLQESEAKHTQLRQQKRSAPGPEPVHSRRVTRSTYNREMLLTEIV